MSGEARLRRIGIMSGGGDCPGLNAVIRAVTKTAIAEHGLEVFGIEDGFLGLIEDRVRPPTKPIRPISALASKSRAGLSART